MRVLKGDVVIKTTSIQAGNVRAAEYEAAKLTRWECGDRYELERPRQLRPIA